jgi:ribosomal-protein-alanine N-acetyltransferase
MNSKNPKPVNELRISLARQAELELLTTFDKEANQTPWSEAEYLSSFYNRNHFIYVLHSKPNTIVGALVISHAAPEAEILQLWIRKGYTERGYARYILEQVLNRLLELGIRKVFLEVRDNNIAAIKLYERCGFKVVGRRADYYKIDSWRIDALTMMRG